MFQYTDGYVKVNGVNIHYYRTGGKKPPFLLLHGATDNGLCWTPVAELLAESYDVIMPDAQGHGLSDRLNKDFTFQSHTVQTVGLARRLGLKKPIIMGHSMGAGTAVNIAVEYPSLPGAIILEDPRWITTASGAVNNAEALNQAEAFHNYLMALNKRPLEEIIGECRAQNPRWTEAEIRPWAESKRQFDPAMFSTMALNPRPYEELVPGIKCPTLLIIAENGLVKAETAQKAVKLWKSKKPFKWVQIKGAGHNIRRDQFDIFRDTVFGFLDSLS